MSPEEITDYWTQRGWISRLGRIGGAHLVLTGGEPILWQDPLTDLLDHLGARRILPFVEVETNGTLLPRPPFDEKVARYNCSPKLLSAGNQKNKAYVIDTLRWFARNPRAIFKFVVQDRADVEEIVANYVVPLDVTSDRIWLMPEAATRARLMEQSNWVVEECKSHGFNFTSRLQLLLWDRATGV